MGKKAISYVRASIQGLLNKQIASELGISEITVRIHRVQVMRKMQGISRPTRHHNEDVPGAEPQRQESLPRM